MNTILYLGDGNERFVQSKFIDFFWIIFVSSQELNFRIFGVGFITMSIWNIFWDIINGVDQQTARSIPHLLGIILTSLLGNTHNVSSLNYEQLLNYQSFVYIFHSKKVMNIISKYCSIPNHLTSIFCHGFRNQRLMETMNKKIMK